MSIKFVAGTYINIKGSTQTLADSIPRGYFQEAVCSYTGLPYQVYHFTYGGWSIYKCRTSENSAGAVILSRATEPQVAAVAENLDLIWGVVHPIVKGWG